MNNMPETDVKYLYMSQYLLGPEICNYGSKSFEIQIITANKIYGYCFRCRNNKCWKPYPIIINSFFAKFSCVPLKLVYVIMKCFIIKDINADKIWKYLVDEKNIIISRNLVLRIYKEIREVLYRYLFIQYRLELFGDSNISKYYSVDVSLFGHKKQFSNMNGRFYK